MEATRIRTGGTTAKNSQNVLKQRFGSFYFALNPNLATIWLHFDILLPF